MEAAGSGHCCWTLASASYCSGASCADASAEELNSLLETGDPKSAEIAEKAAASHFVQQRMHSLIEQGSFEQELHFRPLSDPLLVGWQPAAHTSLEEDLARLPSILKLQIAAAPYFLVAIAGSRQLAQQLDSTNQAQHC